MSLTTAGVPATAPSVGKDHFTSSPETLPGRSRVSAWLDRLPSGSWLNIAQSLGSPETTLTLGTTRSSSTSRRRRGNERDRRGGAEEPTEGANMAHFLSTGGLQEKKSGRGRVDQAPASH